MELGCVLAEYTEYMAMDEISGTKADTLIARLLDRPESARFDTKRVSGEMVGKALETICAFANAQGGVLVLGVEDAGKGQGADRFAALRKFRPK